ncbi:helix-turn-helix domain-containing protein [Dysgonomonas termitidis]|uniref:Helix-turn-helix domain-containing protein n=1 Tax=Dysgonomonas termitidis TaxID=1516126 RepID=A0ABV9L1E9_9BACT
MVAGKYLTFEETKEYMELQKDAIYNLIEKGYIISFVDKNRRRLFDKNSIDEYFKSLIP